MTIDEIQAWLTEAIPGAFPAGEPIEVSRAGGYGTNILATRLAPLIHERFVAPESTSCTVTDWSGA